MVCDLIVVFGRSSYKNWEFHWKRREDEGGREGGHAVEVKRNFEIAILAEEFRLVSIHPQFYTFIRPQKTGGIYFSYFLYIL